MNKSFNMKVKFWFEFLIFFPLMMQGGSTNKCIILHYIGSY